MEINVYRIPKKMLLHENKLLDVLEEKLGKDDEGLYVLDRVVKNATTHYFLMNYDGWYRVCKFQIIDHKGGYGCYLKELLATQSIVEARTRYLEEKNLGKN